MLPKFFTSLFLATSTSVTHMLADMIGVIVAKDVDTQYPMTLPVSTMRIPGAINCTTAHGEEKRACDDWILRVERHVFEGDPKTCSGAHLMSAWNHEGWEHPTQVSFSGIAGGKNKFRAKGAAYCQDAKFVWNDVLTIESNPPGAQKYTQEEVRDICRKAFYYARVTAKGGDPGIKSYIVDTGHRTQAKGDWTAICVRASYYHLDAKSCFPWNSVAYDQNNSGNLC